jgi:hypothetical protein
MRKKLERMKTQISSLCCLLDSEIKSDGSSKLLDTFVEYIHVYIHIYSSYCYVFIIVGIIIDAFKLEGDLKWKMLPELLKNFLNPIFKFYDYKHVYFPSCDNIL